MYAIAFDLVVKDTQDYHQRVFNRLIQTLAQF